MGSVLFADWLRKGFPRAVEEQGLGTSPRSPTTWKPATSCSLGAHRCPSWRRRSGLGRTHPRSSCWETTTPSAASTGTSRAMLSIPKSDFEPFPIFAVPRFLLRPLELQVRAALGAFIGSRSPGRRDPGREAGDRRQHQFRLVQSTMAFFYGRTSGGIGDSQSQNTFMARLVTEYKLISAEELAAAYRLSSDICPGPGSLTPDQARQAYKDGIDEAIKTSASTRPSYAPCSQRCWIASPRRSTPSRRGRSATSRGSHTCAPGSSPISAAATNRSASRPAPTPNRCSTG